MRDGPLWAKLIGVATAFVSLGLLTRGHSPVPLAVPYPTKDGERIAKEAARLGIVGAARPQGLEVYEFADFECPACKGSQARIRDLASSGKISLTFLPYVIPSHSGSEAKALAYLAAPGAAGRARLVDPLWRSARLPDGDPRLLYSFVETSTGEKLGTDSIPESRRRLAACLKLAHEAKIVAVPTFLVRSKSGQWSMTNGWQTVQMLAEGRMASSTASGG